MKTRLIRDFIARYYSRSNYLLLDLIGSRNAMRHKDKLPALFSFGIVPGRVVSRLITGI